jgi:predicted nucleic acid-binding protein
VTQLITLDSSVFIAALRKQEDQFSVCEGLLKAVNNRSYIAVEPYTVLVEIAAAIKRRTGSQELSEKSVKDIQLVSSIFFMDIDTNRALHAVEIAQRYAVRGMDAIIVQIASEFKATLVSLDKEMLEKVKTIVK